MNKNIEQTDVRSNNLEMKPSIGLKTKIPSTDSEIRNLYLNGENAFKELAS